MKMFKFSVVALILFISSFVNAQLINSTIKIDEVKNIFSKKENIHWSVPISNNEKLNISWVEKETSFTPKENIRTFVGYHNQKIVGIVSLISNKIFGNIYWNNSEINLSTNNDGILVFKNNETLNKYGIDSDEVEPDNHRFNHNSRFKVNKNTLKETQEKLVQDDGVLRFYRLVIPISYNTFTHDFKSQMDNVKAFWANTEVGLNEIYTRDIGVKFKIIQDEKLVIQDANKIIYNEGTNSNFILSTSTGEINRLIGSDKYDVGIFMVYNYGGGSYGVARTYMAYSKNDKAAAVVRGTNLYMIAHEIGHLFGASHIHTDTNRSLGFSHKTEIGRGQSVMGYGSPQDFFSLVSLLDIRSKLLSVPYYSDENRTIKVGEKTTPEDFDNFPYGIKTNNKAPIINRENLKSDYNLPPDTFFGFNLSATDEENSILYTVNQVDKVKNDKSFAKFYTPKPSENTEYLYQDEYAGNGFLERDFNTSLNDTYTFWLGVNDGENANLKENYATRYDIYETKVHIIDALPFKFKGNPKFSYKKGEHITLKWDADQKIFAGTKVRILLSDDFGKTFKYTLVESTENDGEEEVIIPQVIIGNIPYKNNVKTVRAGVFKIEVINHIAYALSDLKPTNNRGIFTGGFLVEESNIKFSNLPEPEVFLTEKDAIPAPKEVKATTGYSSIKGGIKFEEKTQQIDEFHKLIIRIWTVEDYFGNKASFVQKIHINSSPKENDFYKPAVSGDSLPSDVLISTLNRNNMTTKQNGILVLESKSKGLVLTKISVGEDISSIQNPVNGMIVFDENDNCIKLYDGTNWDCIKQKAIQIN